ncbi:MAG TPA: hypothetical protein P5125_01470 [Kiritimatiellia bacterium]|nr:hypothetical protein [Candidatus Latescibacterota bacterium]HRU19001.1 hypothetical protein [Kiritimatiellia bacterium]
MTRIVQMAMGLVLVVAMTGCLNIPGKVDLTKAAADAQVLNVTTGDGTFADYKATGYHTSTEIGIAVGIPGLKLLELYPKQDNTEQMTQIAKDAKAGGANAVINAQPPKEMYLGFPFFFIGLYIDQAAGTGIKTK